MVELAVGSYFGDCSMRKLKPDMEDILKYNDSVRKDAIENLKKLDNISLNVLFKELKKTKDYWNNEKRRKERYKNDMLFGMVHSANSLEYVPKIRMFEEVINLKKRLNKTENIPEKNRMIVNYVDNIKDMLVFEAVSNLDYYLGYKT